MKGELCSQASAQVIRNPPTQWVPPYHRYCNAFGRICRGKMFDCCTVVVRCISYFVTIQNPSHRFAKAARLPVCRFFEAFFLLIYGAVTLFEPPYE